MPLVLLGALNGYLRGTPKALYGYSRGTLGFKGSRRMLRGTPAGTVGVLTGSLAALEGYLRMA